MNRGEAALIQEIRFILDRITRLCRGEEVESLPGCVGYYGFPIVPNGPCSECPVREICKRSSKKEAHPK